MIFSSSYELFTMIVNVPILNDYRVIYFDTGVIFCISYNWLLYDKSHIAITFLNPIGSILLLIYDLLLKYISLISLLCSF